MLIGLHGKKRAGKDTVFARLEKLYGEYAPIVRVSFADLLYESAAAALGVTVRDLQDGKSDNRAVVEVKVPLADGSFKVLSSQTFREFLQHYGTEAHRDVFGTNFWVDHVNLLHEGRVVVVTDVRFPNEAQRVRQAGGCVIHVVGPEAIESVGDGHASEAGLPLDLIDRVLLNIPRHDHFEALDAEVDRLMDWLNVPVGARGAKA